MTREIGLRISILPARTTTIHGLTAAHTSITIRHGYQQMTSLLLLDLDGVVVMEVAPPHVLKLEIILLHELLDEILCSIGVPVVVLTHRSRAEAYLILQSAGLTSRAVAGVCAAEDILKAALKSGRRWFLLWHGLKKSWILAEVERRYGVARRDIAFVDDKHDNLEDMLRNGIGLAILAPSGIAADGSTIVSFDFRQMVRLLKGSKGGRTPDIVTLAPQQISVERWSRTGVGTTHTSRHIFNQARRYGRVIRRLVGAS